MTNQVYCDAHCFFLLLSIPFQHLRSECLLILAIFRRIIIYFSIIFTNSRMFGNTINTTSEIKMIIYTCSKVFPNREKQTVRSISIIKNQYSALQNVSGKTLRNIELLAREK